MKFRTSLYGLYLAAALLVTGCGKDIPEDDPGKIPVEWIDASFDITISMAGGQKQRTVRAEEDEKMPGTTNEIKISNIVLFILDLDENGKEIRDPLNPDQVITSTFYTPQKSGQSDDNDGELKLTFRARITTGPKHIYVGANMSREVQQRFIESDLYSNRKNSNFETISSLVDVSDAGNGIVMLGQLKTNNNSSHFTINQGENKFSDTKVELERMVAKVLVACTLNNNGYVNTSGNAGWMELENVQFALSNTSTRFQWSNSPGIGEVTASADELNILQDFTHRDQYNWMTADPVRNEANAKYERGLYCFENGSGISDDKNDVGGNFTATYVIVAAKFVPNRIYTGNNQPQTFTNKSLAEAVLVNSVEGNGTFWLHVTNNGTKNYYNKAGRDRAVQNGTVPGNQFVQYTGGWGYYDTLIDGVNGSSALQWDQNRSRALRNRYYLLCVRQITPPGSGQAVSLASNPDIAVVVRYQDWVPRGGSQFVISVTD